MTTLLTTLRQRLADAESDADRLRAAIQILEQSETTEAASARTPQRRRSAAAGSRRQSSARDRAAAATEKQTAPASSKPASAAATPARRKATSAAATTAPAKATSSSGKSTPAPKAAAKAAPKKRRSAAAKPKAATAVVPLEKLLKVVGENPGLSTTALATRTGGQQSALLELLKESEQKGQVRREGERRGTSWYRVTDEDRIAVRAAEIAAQSKFANGGAAAKPTKK